MTKVTTPPRPKPVALRIELQDITPLVWRRVLVSNQATLASLHNYLQWNMGWTNSHAHEFHIGARGEFEYHYDMGDGWRHRIVIESPPPSWSLGDLPLPACVAGENACPPEDVGGPHGYALFLEVIADSDHEQYEDMLRWIGGVFDPKGFDLNRINRDWRGSKGRRR